MFKINNNLMNNANSVRFGEQVYTMPANIYDTRYKENVQQSQLPDMYNIDDSDKPAFKESFVEGPAGMFFRPWIEHPVATLGTFIGLGFGMDWFTKKCGGKYEDSLVGKVANFGDKIHNSSFVQSSAVKKTSNFLSNGYHKIRKFLGKSDALKAANEMSIQPESAMARGIMYTTEDEIVQEFAQHIVSGGKTMFIFNAEGMGLEPENFAEPINLKNLYIDKDVDNFIKNTYGKSYKQIKNTPEAEKVANHIVLKRLGLNESEISAIINDAEGTIKTKSKVLEIMGKDLKEPLTPELLKKIGQNPKEYKETVRKIAENTKGKVWCAAGDYEWMGPLKHFFKRKISMDGIFNKFQSISKDSGHTSTGRFLSKALQTMYRGLTFGQGKLGALIFIAPGLVEMAVNTKKADKDKKVGTAAWGFISAISWPITFILGGKLLYGAASMHNAGISKENLAKIDNKINEFNIRNENREFKSLGEYFKTRRSYKKEIKALRKVEGMSVFDRILKTVSGIFSYDLKKFNGYRTNSKITTMLNKIPVGIRGKSGLVLKFAVFILAIQPLIDGVMHKCCNAIFGKDYDAMAEDEHKSAKKEQKQFTKADLHKRLLEAQALKNSGEIEQSTLPLPNVGNKKNELGQDVISQESDEIQQNIKEQMLKREPIQQIENNPSEKINSHIAAEENINSPQEEIQENQKSKDIQKNQERNVVTDTEEYLQPQEIQKVPKNSEQDTAIINKPNEQFDNYTYVPSSDNLYKNQKQNAEKIGDNYTYVPSSDNLYKNQKQNAEKIGDNYTYVPSSDNLYKNQKQNAEKNGDNYTYIPSADNVIKAEKEISEKKYIPAQTAGKFDKNFDISGMNDALKRADNAEEKALKILAGNFDDMN